MSTFLDTNIIVALLDTKNAHHRWSVEELNRRKGEGPAIVCDIVYCELSVGMKNKAEADAAIRLFGLERLPHSDAALFRAGEAFKTYKDVNKGPKLGVLPDFLIGALAEVANIPLMTANPKDFVGYFPTMQMISPAAKPAS
jgi:predicted nucleic acid-binding protein